MAARALDPSELAHACSWEPVRVDVFFLEEEEKALTFFFSFFAPAGKSKGRISFLFALFRTLSPLVLHLLLLFPRAPTQGEIGGAGEVGGGGQKSGGGGPFARFFRRSNNNGSTNGGGVGKLSKGEAAALLRQAQHEASYLRSLVQEQEARLQGAGMAAAAAAAVAAEREQQREQQRERGRWDGGGGEGGCMLDLQQQEQQQRQLFLQQRLNYLQVRHELLIDLWTLRVLDNEVLGQQQQQQQHYWGGGGGHG